MNSRERLIKTINHQQPDRLVVDLGATDNTGINASVLYGLRKTLYLEEKPVYVHDPFQMLGMVEEDVRKAIGVDVVGLWKPTNHFGIRNENWKPWKMTDGTPILIAGDFQYDVDKNGVTYTYPQGDKMVKPCAKMPINGYFFDLIERTGEIDEDNLDPISDFKESFSIYDDDLAKYLEKESKRLYEETEYGVIGIFGEGNFGNFALIPGPTLKDPKGIRRLEDWIMAHLLYPDYVMEVFEMQCETALKNLEIYKQAVGDRIQVIKISGTDFGSQKGELISPSIYRKFYKPFHKKLNDWVHANTNWKVFYHTCGSIINLLDDMVEAGVDILNPVQCSASGMDPVTLKEKYGDKLTFWGGGVDTQQTLPFGTVDEVRNQVESRIDALLKNGGFVFSTVHNIVGKTPVENVIAMYETIKELNGRRLR